MAENDAGNGKFGASFCIAPWVHIFFKPTGIVHPCCTSQLALGRLEGQSLLQAWNSPEYKALRQQFLRGEAPKSCEGCYAIEKSGAQSLRDKLNQNHKTEITFVEQTEPDGGVERLNIRYLDVRWSNLCNFRCRFCSVEWSSSWLSDTLAMQGTNSELKAPDDSAYRFKLSGDKKILAPNLQWDEIEQHVLPHVESICFAGGEPLIQEETYKVLRSLVRMGRLDVKLAFVTNLSHFGSKSDGLFELLRGFSQVAFTASADGVGARFEYLRKGGQWDLFSNNMGKISRLLRERQQRLDSIQLYFSVFATNVFHAREAIPAMEHQFGVPVTANLSTNPEFSRIDYLPAFVKNALLDHYAGLTHEQLKHITNFMCKTQIPYSEAIELFSQFIVYTGKLDRLRGEKFAEVFPEWRRFLRSNFAEFISL